MRPALALVCIVCVSAPACVEVAPGVDEARRPVIGGTPTPDGMFPATGALMLDLGGGVWDPSCSGTLIAPDAVLTAGHCVDPLFVGQQIPAFSLLADARSAPQVDVVPGLSTHPHPEFDIEVDIADGLGRWNDIAILRLAEPIEDVDVAVLPSPEEAMALEPGARVDLVGYGLTDVDSFEVGIKHHGEADLVEVGTHELLVSEPGQQQNCNGDSGGPAFVDLGDGPRIVGVVSRSPDDDPDCDHGGVDTRVDRYLEWLHSLVEVECGGLEEPCGELEGGGCCETSGGDQLPGAIICLLVAVFSSCRRRS